MSLNSLLFCLDQMPYNFSSLHHLKALALGIEAELCVVPPFREQPSFATIEAATAALRTLAQDAFLDHVELRF